MIYFNWNRIETVTAEVKDQASETTRKGGAFFPTALGFISQIGDSAENGLHVVTAKKIVKKQSEFEGFMRYSVRQLPKEGRIEASGFIIVVRRSLANQYITTGSTEENPVVLLHVEHLVYGVRTWLCDDPTGTATWELKASGILSNFPPCLPNSAYGTATPGTA